MFLLGGTVGSLLGGSISSYLGRRTTMGWFGIPSMSALLLLAYATSPDMIFVASFIKGISCFIAFTNVGK
jgi:predicted MFS family arabinose efflux permease